MQIYKITIRFLSYIGTPLHSDTIFGHLCWIYRYLYGKERLKEKILHHYETRPHLIVSCGFPAGYLPRPVLPPLSSSDLEAMVDKYFIKKGKHLLRGLDILKKVKKEKFIAKEDMEDIRQDVSEKAVTEILLCGRINNKGEEITHEQLTHVETTIPHNSISRLSGSVLKGGGFYHSAEMTFKYDIDIYIKVDPEIFDIQTIKTVFETLGKYGFGKDKSTGKGQFEVLDITQENLPQEGNAVMSLSYFVPDECLKDGYYNLFTKFGKLGGHYAITEIPFKNPLILMAPGSVFKVKKIKDYYGIGVRNIHAKTKIKHQTYLFPYFLGLSESKHVSNI